MTTKTRFRVWARWAAVLLALVGGSAITWTQGTAAESDFPVFGIGAGQIFRFGVAAVADSSRVGSGARCQASLSFRDAENRPIGTSLDVDLGPNESAFLDLDSRALGLKTRQRVDFRAVLSLKAGSGPCQGSSSVLEALTGRVGSYTENGPVTSIFVQPPCPNLNPAFGILLPPFGAGQTLQVTMVRLTNPVDVNNAPLPCDVALNIRNGGPLTPPVATLVTGQLLPGKSATVSVPFSALNLSFGQTAYLGLDVLGVLVDILFPGFFDVPCPALSSCGCILSTQVIDNLTQRTTVIWAP